MIPQADLCSATARERAAAAAPSRRGSFWRSTTARCRPVTWSGYGPSTQRTSRSLGTPGLASDTNLISVARAVAAARGACAVNALRAPARWEGPSGAAGAGAGALCEFDTRNTSTFEASTQAFNLSSVECAISYGLIAQQTSRCKSSIDCAKWLINTQPFSSNGTLTSFVNPRQHCQGNG